MTAVLPHYTRGPANKQVAVLVFGGQFVMMNTQAYGTTDLTVKLATNATPAAAALSIGVAGADGNVLATQTGAPNTYGQPQIDISVLPDYIPVYPTGWDIPVWFGPSVNVYEGQLLALASAYGTVGPWSQQGGAYAQAAGDPGLIVGRCMVPGGVSAAMCTQQIGGGAGGGAASTYYLGRARILV
jgi:hypothetical protein